MVADSRGGGLKICSPIEAEPAKLRLQRLPGSSVPFEACANLADKPFASLFGTVAQISNGRSASRSHQALPTPAHFFTDLRDAKQAANGTQMFDAGEVRFMAADAAGLDESHPLTFGQFGHRIEPSAFGNELDDFINDWHQHPRGPAVLNAGSMLHHQRVAFVNFAPGLIDEVGKCI